MLEVNNLSKAVLPAARIKRRAVSGVLLLNKLKGLSSNAALQQVRRLFAAEKIGHTGTLDPLASGLLPLMFGEATKFASALIDADKTYTATVCLGFASTTGDAEGLLTPSPQGTWQCLSLAQAQAVCKQFLGLVQQIPPMHSALKKDGKPLYAYARAGLEVERSARTIHVHELSIQELSVYENHALLRFVVRCSKGTYVRTLAEDIAKALGTQGYLTDLERTAIGSLSLSQAYTPAALQALQAEGQLDGCLLPVDTLLVTYPRIALEPVLAARFLQGQRLPLTLEDIQLQPQAFQEPKPQRVRVYRAEPAASIFLGIGLLNTDSSLPTALLQPERLLQSI